MHLSSMSCGITSSYGVEEDGVGYSILEVGNNHAGPLRTGTRHDAHRYS